MKQCKNVLYNSKTGQYRRQSGAILVMFTIGLFSIVAVAALALDGSHMLLNKGRLQNAVDAAAMTAAKIVQGGGTLAQARENAIDVMGINLGHSENSELGAVGLLSSPDYFSEQVTSHVSIEFSAQADPFIPITTEGSEFVRVRVENVQLGNFLAQILDFSKTVRASAVAGKSTDLACINKVVPVLVCGDPALTPDVVGDGVDPYGLSTQKLFVMKRGSNDSDPLGPGNFQLLRINDSSGGDDIRKGLAGEFAPGACITAGDLVPTEPGNTVGPVAQGINTRFGSWQGPTNSTDHPSDSNTCEGTHIDVDDGVMSIGNGANKKYIDENGNLSDSDGNPILDNNGQPVSAGHYTYQNYRDNSVQNCSNINDIAASGDRIYRRELPVVVGDCTGKINGASDIPVLTVGCFFLTQSVEGGGQDSYIIGEFTNLCANSGKAALDPDFESNNSTIVLYRDLSSPDS